MIAHTLLRRSLTVRGWGRRTGTVAGAVVALSVPLLLNPAAAYAGERDQVQERVDQGSETLLRSFAQTFVAGRTGGLDQVDLFLERDNLPQEDLTVQIRTTNSVDGAPTAETLASVTVPQADVPLSADWMSVVFPDPVPVTEGIRYAIVGYARHNIVVSTYHAAGAIVESYPSGSAWEASDVPPGTSWRPESRLNVRDLAFRTYVESTSADLSVTLTDAPDPVGVVNLIGPSQLTYTATVTNNGPTAASGVTLSDQLPSSVGFASASATGGATCSHQTGEVTCTAESVASGGSFTATIKVTPKKVGTVANTVTVAGAADDPIPGNNAATTTTTVKTACLQIDGIRICL